jgi:hypothetical protein
MVALFVWFLGLIWVYLPCKRCRGNFDSARRPYSACRQAGFEIISMNLEDRSKLRRLLVLLSDAPGGSPIPLFLNNAAGDSRSGVPCWIGFVIVLFCVDHDRGSTIVKDRIRPVAQRYHRVQ